MSNKLTLTIPFALPEFPFISVLRAEEINDTKNEVVIALRLYNERVLEEPVDGEPPLAEDAHIVLHPTQPRLRVTDTISDAIEVNPEPMSIQDVITFTTKEIPGAFTQILGAYIQAKATGGDGNGAILNKMAELELIPSGTVS